VLFRSYDPYSRFQHCAELVTAAFRQSFYQKRPEVGLASARAGNVIGGGDWALDRLVPDLVQALKNERKVEIRSPLSVRPWQHVLEPISGYLLLAEKLYEQPQKYSQGYNFGPEDSGCVTVETIADTVCSLWGKPHFWTNTSTENVHEAKLLKLDISKVRNHLKWTPKWDIPTTLKNTVDWYKHFYDKENIKQLTALQIDSYFGIN